MLDFTYRISGEIQQGRIYGEGRGSADPRSGESQMEVHFEARAPGWDPRTIVLICCGRVFAMGAREEDGAKNLAQLSRTGMVVIGRGATGNRRGVIRRSSGEIVANLEASSETRMVRQGAHDVSWLEGGFSMLEPGTDGVAEIHPFTGIMAQAGPRVVTLMTSYRIKAESGEELFGYTFYPHELPDQIIDLPAPQEFAVEAVEQRFDGRRLEMWVRTAVRPLSLVEAFT